MRNLKYSIPKKIPFFFFFFFLMFWKYFSFFLFIKKELGYCHHKSSSCIAINQLKTKRLRALKYLESNVHLASWNCKNYCYNFYKKVLFLLNFVFTLILTILILSLLNFPENFNEILQVVQKIWKFSLSILTIFMNFSHFLIFPCYKESNEFSM